MRRIAQSIGRVLCAGDTLTTSESSQSPSIHVNDPNNHQTPTASQPPESGPLCDICSNLDFHAILRDGVSQHNPVPYDLLTNVLGRAASPGTCAFCSLVGDLVRRLWLLDTPGCASVDLSGITLSLFALTCGHVLGPVPHSTEEERRVGHRIYVLPSERPAEILRAANKAGKALILEVQLMQEDAHRFGRDRVLHGRRMGDVVDIELVRTWLRVCEEQHGERCRAPWWAAPALREDLPKEVRVLDVQKLMLVPASTPVGYRYLALSYVWGSPDICNHGSYWTTSANLEERMSKEGSVLHEKLPAAITDAILTTRTLGERYLWIDALCIAQDSWDDKKIQINVMDRIFLRAAITIFATSSASSGVVSSAAAPLPGLRPGTREVAQKVRVVKGLHLCTPLPRAPEALSQTTWNTRGWTYQEMMLATRRLVFTPDQVFFQCFEDTFAEDVVTEPIPNPFLPASSSPSATSRSEPFFKFGLKFGRLMSQPVPAPEHQWARFPMRRTPLTTYRIAEVPRSRLRDNSLYPQWAGEYMGAVQTYATRGLTNEGDAVPAFSGLANMLVRAFDLVDPGDDASRAYVYGMPIKGLDSVLLWQPKPDAVHERRMVEIDGQKRVVAPSWSWAAWKGEVRYTGESQYQSIHDGGGKCNVGESMVQAWFLVEDDSGSSSNLAMGRKLQLRRLNVTLTPRRVIDPEFPHPVYIPPTNDSVPELPLPELWPGRGIYPGTLVFRTSVARVLLEWEDDSSAPGIAVTGKEHRYFIVRTLAHRNDQIGPSDALHDANPTKIGRVILPCTHPQRAEVDLAVVGRTDYVKNSLWRPGAARDEYAWFLLYVMVMAPAAGQGVARERIGLGVVLDRMWAEAGPREEVVLLN